MWALAIENNRLYYSVADGPSVWSVGLNADGSFAADPRREIDVQKTPQGNQITSILFDGPNTVYLAQRGSQLGSYDYQSFMRPQESTAMRYKWNEAERRWAAAYEEYAVGLPPEHHAAVGGLALNYGYDRFGNIDYGRCRQTLWITGEHLRAGSDIVRVARGGPEQVNGLQGIYKSRVKPDNEPPFESWYVDYDATFADAEAYGHVGNVAIYNPCAAGVTYSADRVEVPVWTKGPDLVVDKVCYPGLVGGRIRCTISVRNKGDGPATGIIELLDETRTLWGKAADELIPIASSEPDGAGWTCATIASGALACRLDAGSFAAGAVRKLSVWVDTHDLVAAGNLGFRNCVTLNHPAGRGKACAEGGTDIVVEKIGPSRCTPGEDCTFTLKLTNKSLMAFDADVLLADHMLLGGAAVAASISEIEPPLGCTDEPTKLPFSCVARVTLGPGAVPRAQDRRGDAGQVAGVGCELLRGERSLARQGAEDPGRSACATEDQGQVEGFAGRASVVRLVQDRRQEGCCTQEVRAQLRCAGLGAAAWVPATVGGVCRRASAVAERTLPVPAERAVGSRHEQLPGAASVLEQGASASGRVLLSTRDGLVAADGELPPEARGWLS